MLNLRRKEKSNYVYKITTPNGAGTGFQLRNGLIVTNKHVIGECMPSQINISTPEGKIIEISMSYTVDNIDICLLDPKQKITEGLLLEKISKGKVGDKVETIGYPFNRQYSKSLLSIGYLSAYNAENPKSWVVNGAFNPGNSGGPLFHYKKNQVLGLVTAKHGLSEISKNIISTLSSTKFGLQHNVNVNGEQKQISEAQLVSVVLTDCEKLIQVMIGLAICASEIIKAVELVAERYLEESKKHSSKQALVFLKKSLALLTDQKLKGSKLIPLIKKQIKITKSQATFNI